MIRYYRIFDVYNSPKKKIVPNRPYAEIHAFLEPFSSSPLPDGVEWRVKKGNRWSDQIPYFEAEVHKFYSARIVELLSSKINLTGRCFPLKIVGDDVPEVMYYSLYNLPSYVCLNLERLRDPYTPDDTPIFLLPADGTIPVGILTLDHTIYKIVDEETMRQMKEMKATNMAFEEAYAVTQEEWDEMRRHNRWTIGSLLKKAIATISK